MYFTVLIAVSLVSWCAGRLMTIYAPKSPVDRLKNALLALALAKACKNDMSSDLEYGAYDGSRLPAMAGIDLAGACFTYIIDPADLRKDAIGDIVAGRASAILKYIDRNIDTDEKAVLIFNRYIEELRA